MFFQLISYGDFFNSRSALLLKNLQEILEQDNFNEKDESVEIEFLTFNDSLEDLKNKLSKYNYGNFEISFNLIPDDLPELGPEREFYKKTRSQLSFCYRIKRLYELKQSKKYVTLLDNDILIKRSFLGHYKNFIESGKIYGGITEFFYEKGVVEHEGCSSEGMTFKTTDYLNFGFCFLNLRKIPSSYEEFVKQFNEDIRYFTRFDQSRFSSILSREDIFRIQNLQLVQWGLNFCDFKSFDPETYERAKLGTPLDLNTVCAIHYSFIEQSKFTPKSLTLDSYNLILLLFYEEFYEFALKYKKELGKAFEEIENTHKKILYFKRKNLISIKTNFKRLLKNSI